MIGNGARNFFRRCCNLQRNAVAISLVRKFSFGSFVERLDRHISVVCAVVDDGAVSKVENSE